MKPFVPAFDALWHGSKAHLHNATRAIFLKLCQEARNANRDGVVVLPRARDDAASVAMLAPGTKAEIVTALAEMTDAGDPMVSITDQDGRRVLRILSWEGWALVGKKGAEGPKGRVGRPRKWESEADRSRARRSATTGNSTGNVSGRPETDNRSTGNQSENKTGFASGAMGGKGGAMPPDQIKEEENKVQENTGEEAARGGARATSPPTDARVERLLAGLRRSPALVEMDGSGQLDVVQCAIDLANDGVNYVMGGKLREDEVDERLDAVVADLVREVAAAARTSQPWSAREVSRKQGTFAATTLSKSREEWAGRQGRPSSPQRSEDLQKVLEIFCIIWKAKKGRDYVLPSSAENHASKLLEAAQREARKKPDALRPREIVMHWATEYLREDDRKIADEEHPLALLPSRIDRYGLPRALKPQAPPASPQPPPSHAPEAGAVPAPAEMLKRLGRPSNDTAARTGTGGDS